MQDNPLPLRSGVGLKPRHYEQILGGSTTVSWFEIHPENYMGDGGLPHKYLEAVRNEFPLTMHGVGMSLGSADGIDERHLNALHRLVERYKPSVVSEHLAWSHFNQVFHNDLLPLMCTEASLTLVASNIRRVQDKLQREILIENPSSYLSFANSEMDEPEFVNRLVKMTGCGLLLDINNVYVSAKNNDFDPRAYLDKIDPERVGEIHLAGHSVERLEEGELRIDDHGSPVIEEVWTLYAEFLARSKVGVPTLIEWDTDVPDWQVLQSEAEKAQVILDRLEISARQVAHG